MTAQIPDKLRYDGKLHSLFAEPLESWPGKAGVHLVAGNTANWRGYIALWEIADGKLYFKDVSGKVCAKTEEAELPVSKCGRRHGGACEPREALLEDIFPGANGQVLATWFSGTLKVPLGKMLNYVHMGYASEFEGYLLIDVVGGHVTQTREIKSELKNTSTERPKRRGVWGWFG